VRSIRALLAWALFVVSASGAFLTTRAVSSTSSRGFTYMPDMAQSVPYNAFSPNPVLRDRKTLQAPMRGTIPRGFQPLRYGATPEEAVRAGRELRNPVPVTPEALARGQLLYETFCLVCHGAQGQGDGPLVPRIPNPPSYTSERVRAMAPGQILHTITFGSGRMPSYAAQIPLQQRWFIVHYVEMLQQGEAGRP
jgi:mono/diheme cytochrome c family protein